jgi:RHS repeat-associated protein
LTYDAGNQLTKEVSVDGTENYAFDADGQLTSATGWRNEAYSYDATGNRTMAGYQTGTGNELLTDGTYNYTYDADGNMLTKTQISSGNVTTYTWDYRNRLTAVVTKHSVGTVLQQSNYTYDAFDNRIGVNVNGTQTWTVYDGQNPYADFSGTGALLYHYLYGPAVDQILARVAPNWTTTWYLTDQLGSVRDLAGKSGTVIDHIQYGSFGNVISESSPSNGDRFKFTGRELDATGDYYYRARYYNPGAGRFASQDPMGFAAGDTDVYRYVANGPTERTDPTGQITSTLPSVAIPATNFSLGVLSATLTGTAKLTSHVIFANGDYDLWVEGTVFPIVSGGPCKFKVGPVTGVTYSGQASVSSDTDSEGVEIESEDDEGAWLLPPNPKAGFATVGGEFSVSA